MGNLINLRAFGPGCCKWSTFSRPHWWEQKFAGKPVGTLSPVKYITSAKRCSHLQKVFPFVRRKHDIMTLTPWPTFPQFHGSVPLVAFVRRQQSLSLWPTDSSCSQRLPRSKQFWRKDGSTSQQAQRPRSFALLKRRGWKLSLFSVECKILQKLQLHTFPSHILFSAQQNELMSIL